MTLHEAIEQVLLESDSKMTAHEIADQINDRKIYQRKDGLLIKPSQIYARIAHYANIFELKRDKLIGLIEKEIITYKELVKKLSRNLRTALPVNKIRTILPTLIYLVWKYNADFKVNNNYSSKSSRDTFFEIFYKIDFPSHCSLLHQDFIFLFEDLQESQFEEIFTIINGSGIENISELEFGPFFDEMINENSWRETVRGRENSVPRHLIDLVSKIVRIGDLEIINDPYAGNASQLVAILNQHIRDNIYCYAIDKNQESILLGTLNLLANGCKDFIYTDTADLIDVWGDEKMDCTVAIPPFSGRLQEMFIWHSPYGEEIQTSDPLSAAIVNIVNQLKSRGRAYITVPIGFLFRQEKFIKEVRKFLIKEKLLAGIIALPQSLFKPYTNILTVLLVIDSVQGNSTNRLLYYDLTSINPEVIPTYSNEIANLLYISDLKEGKNFRFIDYSLIKERKFRLDKIYYLNSQHSESLPQSMNWSEQIGSLKSHLVNWYPGRTVNPSNLNSYEGIPYIQVSNLSNNIGINELDLSQIKRYVSDIELIPGQLRFVDPNSILISKVGLNLKATLFKNNNKILCSSNIIVLQPNSTILPEYLVAILQDKSITEQVDFIRSISGVPNFRLSDFLEININVPSIDQQRDFVTQFFANQLQEKTILTEKAEGEDLYNIISRMKHELMQSVSSWGIDIRLIKDYLEEKEKNVDTITLQDPLITILPGMEAATIDRSRLESVLTRMLKCQKDAHETLIKAEETLRIGISSFNPEEFKLKSYLKEEILPVYDNANCNIRIIGDEHIIKADKYQLKVLFKNLIDNALNHGFDPLWTKTDNIININLKGLDSITRYHEIIVENNGRPFPHGFDLTIFETRGISDGKNKGTGFGGYHIKKVIENHKGMMKIARDEEIQYTDFKVKFIIHLPE